ncbi:MAG: sensor histidine kinase [Thermoleophilia bacterium]
MARERPCGTLLADRDLTVVRVDEACAGLVHPRRPAACRGAALGTVLPGAEAAARRALDGAPAAVELDAGDGGGPWLLVATAVPDGVLLTAVDRSAEWRRAVAAETWRAVSAALDAPGDLPSRLAGAARVAGEALGGACGIEGPEGGRACHDASLDGVRAVARRAAVLVASSAGADVTVRENGLSALVAPLGGTAGWIWFARRRPWDAHGRDVARGVGRLVLRAVEAERRARVQRRESEQLARSDALKTALLSGVTHEFRNPLTGIANAADALSLVTEGAERDGLLEAIQGETRRLERLVTNLLDLSRLEGGVLAARPDWCSPEELAAGAVAACEPFMRPGDVRVEIDDDVPLVHADAVLVERVLVNLLHNAVRHGRPPVTLGGAVRDGALELSVEDRGPGVDAEVLPSVFEPFVHREGVGLGLGLPLCRRLAEAQGGRLEHRVVPRGARFVLVLPLPSPPKVHT